MDLQNTLKQYEKSSFGLENRVWKNAINPCIHQVFLEGNVSKRLLSETGPLLTSLDLIWKEMNFSEIPVL